MHIRNSLLLVSALLLPASALAQRPPQAPPPTVPAITATQVSEPIRIDGQLDEPLYRDVPPVTGFLQVEPRAGQPATEKTELWIAYDKDNVYVTFRNWESEPSRIVAKEMRRDTASMWGGDDIVSFIIDTFHDGRNGYQFALNSIGGHDDGQVSNERQYNGDWNTVWDYKAARFDGGWVVEVALPFKSLRYGSGVDQTWGFNALRTNRWKNELSFLSPPPTARGQGGIQQTSLAAVVTGIKAPGGSKNLELKPYVISNTTTARNTARRLGTDVTGDVGGDLKYGLSQNMTLDVTWNTDFAQVEADTQQVNLTRFSLFFPEKREFFLENQGTFNFGSASGDVPLLFYSRRIGLDGGQSVPLNVGGRLTGRVGRYTIGVMNLQTGEEDAVKALPTNFSVLRVRRDILRRSTIGVMATGRYGTQTSATDNAAYGVDATFGFFRNLTINSYWARTDARGTSKTDDTSYRGQLDYNADRYGLQLERLVVGRNFNPGVGFVRRPDIEKSFALARFSPRPRANRVIRKYWFVGSTGYIQNGAGRLDTRTRDLEFDVDFANTDRFQMIWNNTHEFLPAPFRIATGITLPTGPYDYDNVHLQFNRAARRRVAGNVSVDRGTFYNGHKTGFGVSGGRVSVTPQLAFEPSYSVNRAELVQGNFTTQLAGLRAIVTPTAKMFTSAFLQYNSSTHSVSANVRLRWEYQPGSELFVVYNEDRDSEARGFPELSNRAFIVKVNRLVRF
jgi:hypothetical protein